MEEEFEEEEVWAMAREKKDDSPKTRKQKEASFSSHPAASRKMPRSNLIGEQSRQSAPVNIPNWSKIYKRSGSLNAGVEGGGNAGGDDDDDNADDDDEEEKLPPHEWLARKMARSQISSSSVCEGAGRTLKGRDQRKVRDAVLTRTGFLE